MKGQESQEEGFRYRQENVYTYWQINNQNNRLWQHEKAGTAACRLWVKLNHVCSTRHGVSLLRWIWVTALRRRKGNVKGNSIVPVMIYYQRDGGT